MSFHTISLALIFLGSDIPTSLSIPDGAALVQAACTIEITCGSPATSVIVPTPQCIPS